ncbi:hypothetical protein EVAR_87406_1 [Eumeta japonica]|uniref:Uncharacterized protein n=1 Tax=Eumeta variegata TaxID=151549 RepID=A0A4C1XKJ0_EUMVA|nr:hypothetical protein EVAR_87406_1 [Eumeta japonica]
MKGRPGEWHVSTARADRPTGTREIDPILPEEWKIIECCVELLKPFEETRELSSSHTHLISDSDNSDADAKTETPKTSWLLEQYLKYRKSEENENDRFHGHGFGTTRDFRQGRQSCLMMILP